MDRKQLNKTSVQSPNGLAPQQCSFRQKDCWTRLPLPEFVERMAQTPTAAEQTLIKARWPYGTHCPHCNSAEVRAEDTWAEEDQTTFRCRPCAKTFTVRTNHFTEYPPGIPIQTWLVALYLMVSEPRFLSEQQMARYLGVDQATAHLMIHSIHFQMQDTYPLPLQAPNGLLKVEMDESFWPKHWKSEAGRRFNRQLYMIALLDRSSGQVRITVAPSRTVKDLLSLLAPHDLKGVSDMILYTDGLRDYATLAELLRKTFGVAVRHGVVNHNAKEYVSLVDPDCHVNGLESLFAWIRHALSNVEISQENIARYAVHCEAMFNHRRLPVIERMEMVMARENGVLTEGRICRERKRFSTLPGQGVLVPRR